MVENRTQRFLDTGKGVRPGDRGFGVHGKDAMRGPQRFLTFLKNSLVYRNFDGPNGSVMSMMTASKFSGCSSTNFLPSTMFIRTRGSEKASWWIEERYFFEKAMTPSSSSARSTVSTHGIFKHFSEDTAVAAADDQDAARIGVRA